MKERSRDEQTPLKQIYNQEVERLSKSKKNYQSAIIAAYAPKFESLESALLRHRRKLTPTLPTTVIEIELIDEWTLTRLKTRFLLIDTKANDRITIFASDNGLSMLSMATQWHADATFKATPSLYYQLVIITIIHYCL